MKVFSLMILALFVSSLTPIHAAPSTSICTQIQDRKDYFKINVDRDWSTLSETIKYQKYVELVLKNPGCVSSMDFRYAKGYIEDIIQNCPPRKGTLMDLYGIKTLKQMCNWASNTKKRQL
jgi:hypothetical protein